MTSRIKEAVVLAIAILGVGTLFYKSQTDVKKMDRVVTVRGLAERTVQSDFCIWPITFKETGNDLPALYSSIQAKTELLEKFLLENGVDSSEISRGAPDIFDTDSEVYSDRKHAARYNATVVLTVASGKVELLRNLMAKQSELLKQGIAFTEGDYRYRKVFNFNGLNAIKPTMIEEATKNARVAAEKFAKDSGSKIGKIKSASQGLFSLENRDESTPHIKVVRVVTSVQYYLED